MGRLSDGYSMMEINAPGTFIGRSIKELNLRAEYGVQIFLIARQDMSRLEENSCSPREFKFVPDPEYRVQRGDRLILVGEDFQIEKIKKL